MEGSDGRPKYNYVGYNIIYSDRDEVAKVSETDDNVFEVRWFTEFVEDRHLKMEGANIHLLCVTKVHLAVATSLLTTIHVLSFLCRTFPQLAAPDPP